MSKYKIIKPEIKDNFTKLPNVIFKLPIRALDRFVLAYLFSHADRYRISRTQIKEGLGVDMRTINKSLDNLIAKEYISFTDKVLNIHFEKITESSGELHQTKEPEPIVENSQRVVENTTTIVENSTNKQGRTPLPNSGEHHRNNTNNKNKEKNNKKDYKQDSDIAMRCPTSMDKIFFNSSSDDLFNLDEATSEWLSKMQNRKLSKQELKQREEAVSAFDGLFED